MQSGAEFLIYQVYLICIYQSFTPRNTLQLQQKKIVAVLNVLIATRFPLPLCFAHFTFFQNNRLVHSLQVTFINRSELWSEIFLNQNIYPNSNGYQTFCEKSNKVNAYLYVFHLLIAMEATVNNLIQAMNFKSLMQC